MADMKSTIQNRLPKDLKNSACNFSVSPMVRDKIAKVKFKKSPFINAVLEAVPESWIKTYNSDPLNFKPQI